MLGNLLVLRDETHITAPMAEFLRPLLEAALGELVVIARCGPAAVLVVTAAVLAYKLTGRL